MRHILTTILTVVLTATLGAGAVAAAPEATVPRSSRTSNRPRRRNPEIFLRRGRPGPVPAMKILRSGRRPSSVLAIAAAAAILVPTAVTAAESPRAVPAHAQPDNDDYADAAPVPSLPFADIQDISGSTTESVEMMPSCGAPLPALADEALAADFGSVWYRFEPAEDITITIDPRDSDFDMFFAVYDGEDLLTQQEVGCGRTDINSSGSVITLDVVAGHSYAIQLLRVYAPDGTTLSFAITPGAEVVEPRVPEFREDLASEPATGDATVIAILDTGISPYHWDFLASRMPQALDDNPANDLPLDQPPDTWLTGFPDRESAFASFNRVDLALEEDDPTKTYDELRPADANDWDAVRPSTPDAIHYHWFPGTKVIGGVTFSPDGRIEPATPPLEHGHIVSGGAVGNFVGTCPECLLVLVQMEPAETGEQSNQQLAAALEWALDQPWIDVVSSSAFISVDSSTPLIYPDWLESAFDMDLERAAAERGQTLFQAAGNGLAGQFIAPNPTLTPSHMGPDWLVTVGGIGRNGEHRSGAGKPADVAATSNGYPATFPRQGVGTHATIGGTSISAPTIAGTYAHALYHTRRSLPGASRTQENGVIARTQGSFACDAERPDCELADGDLTASELRTRLFHGASPTGDSTSVGLGGGIGLGDAVEDPAPIAEEWRLLNQGHGAYFGRILSDDAWLDESDRVLAPIQGRAATLDRPEGERDWMIVDSFCRQHMWGAWDGGYFVEGETPLPGPDAAWPIRTGIETACPFTPERSAGRGQEPQHVDDADPAVEYRRGWHRREDSAASNGGYHRRIGSAGNGQARLVFEGQAITYFFARSEQGGTADVFVDGELVSTVDYSGPAPGNKPEFGHSVTFDGLGEGSHEMRIVHRSGAVYVDGFEIAFD